MVKRVRRWGAVCAIGALSGLVAFGPVNAAERERRKPADGAGSVVVQGTAQRSAPVTPFVFDGDLRHLPPTRRWKPGDPIKEIPRRAYVDPDDKAVTPQIVEGVDRLLDVARAAVEQDGARGFDTPETNFDGQGFSGVNPPDPSGDIGPGHYIQMINAGGGATVRIYDKSLPTPNVLTTFDLDSLGSGSCATGLGDPIVLYDRAADRWMLTEFSSSGNQLCMYVSQTPDPVAGGWFFYGFTGNSFPDYPKYGVWPTDANGGAGSYIVTTNETSSGVYAMDRAAMLAGTAATFQRFSIADLPGFSFNAVTPADLDGADGPPSGAPAVIMRQRDTEVHSGPSAAEDVLEIWHFDVDWASEANTTLTQLPNIDVAELSSELCGLSAFACFPQPGSGTTLDPLREPIMNRLQYRNFGDRETLVGNFVTDVDGTDRGGVRWFELRRVGGIASPWSLEQEGLISPDGDSRFMAAGAMDQSGNIAMAYNITSTSTFPGLRYSGRLADDPAGSMQAEVSLIEGSAANSSNRYGDYSQMGVDPADDCTFWFTAEYNAGSSWSTRVASFRFDACGCDLLPLPLSLSGGNNGDNRIDLAWGDSELASVVEYRVQRSRTAGGPYTTVATVADTSLGTGGSGSYAYSDTTVSGGIDYFYIVRASDGGACTSDPSNELSETATGICLLEPLFDGIVSATTPNSGICTVNLDWDAAADQCGGPVSYEVHRSTDPDFVPDGLTLLASGVSATSYADGDALVNGTPYFYVARAVDEFNGVGETNTARASAIPRGTLQPPLFVDDGGDGSPAQLTIETPWSNDPSGGNLGPAVYATGAYGNNLCAALTMPAVTLGSGNLLEFRSRYEIENSWDKGEVQISTDGGASWSRLDAGYPGTSSNVADACGFPTGQYFTGSNTDWGRYTADLSAYDGQTVQIRFVLSTDGSVNSNGWRIDDIAIANSPASCATASSCAENPLVDVMPDGPFDSCALSTPLLSAGLSGGSGPFEYQWYRDGSPIPGATDPEYQVVDGGSYNVRVRSTSCPDEVADGQSTTIGVATAPLFSGLTSAVNRGTATCGVELDWAPASTICPGPVVYNVYRSRSASVTPTAGNLIASGLGATGYTDVDSLDSGETYHYLVRAIDLSTNDDDDNAVERSAIPGGPDSVAFSDDAGDTGGATLVASAPWGVQASGGDTGPSVYATGAYSSDLCASLETPAIPIAPGSSLEFSSRHEIEANWDKGVVEVSVDGGTSWSRVDVDYPFSATQTADACGLPTGTYFTSDSPDWARYSADLSAWAGQSAVLRWQLSTDGSVTDNGWWVDDVVVRSPSSCASVASGPSPAPDGQLGTSPLRGDRATIAGDTIDVSWDATSCPASDYNLIFGDLAAVASYALDGSACGLGTSGTFVWSGVPAGDLYFLVIGSDAAGTESSWGAANPALERNGPTPSGECGVTSKAGSPSCP